MLNQSGFRKIALLSILLALAMGISSWGGLFLTGTYSKETPAWAAQGMGQDAVNLIIVVPLLLASAYFAVKGRKIFLLMLAGIFIYSIYSYILYGFCVHFNRLFFAYCAALGFSFYGLALVAGELPGDKVKSWFDTSVPTMLPSVYCMALTGVFYLLWLSEDLPAVWSGTAPKSLSVAGLFTNPVHVLDLSIVLPAMFIASIQLWKKKAWGYLFFPAMMVFSIVMGLAIVGMMLAMNRLGVGGNPGPAGFFGLVILLSVGVLGNFLKTLKHPG